MLLQKLMSIGLPPIIIRSLMYMYYNSKIQVKWKDSISVPFDTANGVKQRFVLSQILFTLLLDDLLFELENSVDGCRIGTNYYGCVGYAGDLKLLCPGLKGLQKMLNICNKYSCSNGLIFSATKTMCIQFHYGNIVVRYPSIQFFLVLDKLQWYSQVKHLGHIFNCCSRDVLNNHN